MHPVVRRVANPEDGRAMTDKAETEQTPASKRAVYIEELAEQIYEKAVLCGQTDDPVDDWTRLPVSLKCRYRFAAKAALNGLDIDKQREAELRAREQVADAHYHKAFHLLAPTVQRFIVFSNRTAIQTNARVLEEIFEPLPARIALTLEPAEVPS